MDLGQDVPDAGRLDDGADGVLVALKVGNERLDAATGRLKANLLNRQGEGARAAGKIVIAINAGEDGELQAERRDGLSHAARLVKVNGRGTPLGHGAEAAVASAEIAQQQESRSPGLPALADIGAAGALTDGVEIERAGQPLERVVVFAGRRARPEPRGLGCWSLAGKRDLHQFCHTLIVFRLRIQKNFAG